jgi:hypothetical protein
MSREKVLQAVFTGQNGYLGYKTGVKYVLQFRMGNWIKGYFIKVRRLDTHQWYALPSVDDFFHNWTNVKMLS